MTHPASSASTRQHLFIHCQVFPRPSGDPRLIQCKRPRVRANRRVNVVNQKSGHPWIDRLVQRAASVADDRRPTNHRLHNGQSEGLVETQRVQQNHGLTHTVNALMSADVSPIPHRNAVDMRCDTFGVVPLVLHRPANNQWRSILAGDFANPLWRTGLRPRRWRPVVLFPQRTGGRYTGLFRPNDEPRGDVGGLFQQIRIGYADDYRTGPWDISEMPLTSTHGSPSALPTRSALVLHRCAPNTAGSTFSTAFAPQWTVILMCSVSVLHDLDRPEIVRMSGIPVLFPSRADCRVAESDYVHVPNVVEPGRQS